MAAGVCDRGGQLDGVPPSLLSEAVANSSADYDYAEWNRTGRKQAGAIVKKETRNQPRPTEPLEIEPDVRVVTPVGGTLMFSAAQLHSTVPNATARTRFSIDFRTVNLTVVAASDSRRDGLRDPLPRSRG